MSPSFHLQFERIKGETLESAALCKAHHSIQLTNLGAIISKVQLQNRQNIIYDSEKTKKKTIHRWFFSYQCFQLNFTHCAFKQTLTRFELDFYLFADPFAVIISNLSTDVFFCWKSDLSLCVSASSTEEKKMKVVQLFPSTTSDCLWDRKGCAFHKLIPTLTFNSPPQTGAIAHF